MFNNLKIVASKHRVRSAHSDWEDKMELDEKCLPPVELDSISAHITIAMARPKYETHLKD